MIDYYFLLQKIDILSAYFFLYIMHFNFMSYLDKRIKKCIIPNKGFGMVATDNIKKGTVLIRDIPFTIPTNKIYSEIFQLIYEVINNENMSKKFFKLQPKSLNGYKIDKNKIGNELIKVKNNDANMYNFFVDNYTFDELLLFCAKYMCNAFEYQGKPCFLFTGTLLNHSCLPNVIFGNNGNEMIFVAVRDINKGEEICDNYIDITLPRKERKKHLLEQYGFECYCEQCIKGCNFDKSIIIEKERLLKFGFTKSQIIG
jgi:hypothetical protein